MEDYMKKFYVGLAAVLSCAVILSSCGGPGPLGPSGGQEIDKSKSQLYVANYDGGVGSEWLRKVIKKFEDKYANESFEEDKMGVEIITDIGKADHLSSIGTDSYNVIFAESVDVNALIAAGSILDITDITRAVGEDGKTIESKMSDYQKSALSVYGGYYALPHYEYYPGITYDKDLFNTKSLYISANGGYTNAAGNLSAGPDGRKGTYDDGLPATIEEFVALCRYMKDEENVSPFIYAGGMPSYTDVILEGLTLSLTGEDEFMLNFTFDSTKGGTLSGNDLIKTKVVTGWNGNVPVIEEKTVSDRTGYYTTMMASKYYAMSFLQTIASDTDTFINSQVSSSMDHLGAQRKYVFSALDNNEPTAMLIEGSFWYNEAKTANSFTDSINQYGERAKNRNFGWMPLPTAVSGSVNESNGRSFRLVDEANSYAIINANIKNDDVKVRLAKLFLQYCYTDENLELFTASTGCFKALDYSLSDETYRGLDKFYQSIADIRRESGVVRPLSGSPIYTNNQHSFMFMRTYYFTTPRYRNAFTVFKNGTASAADFFIEMNSSESNWANLYGSYFA